MPLGPVMSDPVMKDRVCLVTGASRGVGKGIALALGDAGATVYVTGRTTDADADAGTRGTIDRTAFEISERGGRGLAIRCDHTNEPEVAAAFDRIAAEQDGRLDVVVSNAWGGYEAYDAGEFSLPFWEQPFSARWAGMFEAGVKAHLLTCQLGARAMQTRGSGLLVATLSWDRDRYYEQYPNVFYYASSQAVRRALIAIGADLKPSGVAAIGLAPGFTRTEKVLDAFGIGASEWESVEALAMSESPLYPGRAVVALATDPQVMERTGGVFKSGELAEAYGFTDIDGRVVPPFEPPV